MRFGHRILLAHRAAWSARYGEIPSGLCACHRCDVRMCINPDHLFLGTPLDNSNDKIAKGRQVSLRGEQSACAKLTQREVEDIRRSLAAGARQCDLARQFGVSHSTVGHIKMGRSWQVAR